jgi:hypothetical protein
MIVSSVPGSPPFGDLITDLIGQGLPFLTGLLKPPQIQPAAPPYVPPPPASSIPDWVWVVVPLGIGLTVFAVAVTRK